MTAFQTDLIFPMLRKPGETDPQKKFYSIPGMDFVGKLLADMGMYKLKVSTTAPTVDLTTTLWLKPGFPAFTTPATPFLYDTASATWVDASTRPDLWSQLLHEGTNPPAILTGAVPPVAGDGADGDLYFNTAAPFGVYVKTGGAWVNGNPEKATSAEATAGTDDAKFVTPAGVAAAITAATGGGPTVATNAEALAGTENTRTMTPLRVREAIDGRVGTATAAAIAAANVPVNATNAEALAGTDDTKFMTPLDVKNAIAASAGGGGGGIAADSITATEIAANAVGASELAANAVAAAHIAANAVGASEIAANAVGASELAANAVSSAHIVNSSILEGDLHPTVRTKLNASGGVSRYNNGHTVPTTGYYLKVAGSVTSLATGPYPAGTTFPGPNARYIGPL